MSETIILNPAFGHRNTEESISVSPRSRSQWHREYAGEIVQSDFSTEYPSAFRISRQYSALLYNQSKARHDQEAGQLQTVYTLPSNSGK